MERGESRAGSRNSYFSAPLLLPPLPPTSFLFIRRFKNIYIYIIYLFWLCRVLVEACKIFPVACFSCGMQTLSCSMQDLVPRPGIEPGPPALGAQSLTHWTTWEVPLPNFLFIYLFIYLWLCWVFVSVQGLSLVAASGGHSSSRCAGLSLSRPLLLRSTGSRRAVSVAVAHGPSCSAACGIFPDQGSNPCPLHWQADS